MNLATYYARALFDLITKDPKKEDIYLKNLQDVLRRRGHSKLSPRILSAYRALELSRERSLKHTQVAPEKENTRKLIELYRVLINS